MSSSEEELQKKIDKLEITPATKICITQMSTAKEYHLRSHACRRCRVRRRSESILDDFKALPAAYNTSEELSWTRSTPGVQKQSLKKTSPSNGATRKVLIREPILKALQNCFHPHSSRRQLLTKTDSNTVASSDSYAARGMPNFHDLMKECQSLLEQDVEHSGYLRRRNSKNFTTMQENTTSNYTKSHKRDSRLLSKNSETSSPPPSPEHNVSTSRATISSCSQQAGNAKTVACDDVTINELACYFDTFVHIPKKMSSMAEMMYI